MFFYDPESFDFWGLVRSTPEEDWTPIMAMTFPWTSPTLGIRFEMFDDGLAVFHPDGERFKDPDEVFEERKSSAARNEIRPSRNETRAFAKLRELGIDPETL